MYAPLPYTALFCVGKHDIAAMLAQPFPYLIEKHLRGDPAVNLHNHLRREHPAGMLSLRYRKRQVADHLLQQTLSHDFIPSIEATRATPLIKAATSSSVL